MQSMKTQFLDLYPHSVQPRDYIHDVIAYLKRVTIGFPRHIRTMFVQIHFLIIQFRPGKIRTCVC